ncbi:DUF7065 domain-containing protein [Nocardia rhamnosiphila]|uniref:Uncharacterized protein n=1 Tax=Nocardia rhamnosiphila TaxID=426716 RepID=A0ABV2X275_9NOCA
MNTSETSPITALEYQPADDYLHPAAHDGDWWGTETYWFSFNDPQRGLGGWLYTMVRPTIGTVAGGAWIWDDTASLPWEVLHYSNYTALPWREQDESDSIHFPTGLTLSILEPGMSYRLQYEDGDRAQLDLHFEGVMPPEPLRTGKSTFGRAAHFDQLGRVRGTLAVAGEQVDIDCLAMRDRTWGRRREDRPARAAYVTGAFSEDEAFLLVTGNSKTEENAAYGFLRRDGRTVPLAEGTRIVERHPEHGWVSHIGVTVRDCDGRELNATGTPINRIVINRHTFIDINSVIRWTIDGVPAEGWGEDQDMWPVHAWAENHRRIRGADGSELG